MRIKRRVNLQYSKVDTWTVAQLGSFYGEHRNQFLVHASRILKDKVRAEEVVQDALIRVLLAAPELSSIEHALGYMHRTIENLCVDIFRLEGRRPNLVALDELMEQVDTSWQAQADLADIVSASDDAVIVRQALSLLSPAERAALVMWEMEGRSAKEIARELGVKETSVRHTVSRARASLKRILSEIVLDESRGLTALDMLSTTYRKSAELTKNSSKIALSVALLFFAVLGFSSMSIVGQNSSNILNDYETLQLDNQIGGSPGYNTEEHSASSSSIVSQNRIPAKKQNDKNLDIPGLDESGLPVGFTISDSKGGVGVAYFRERDPLRSDAALRGRQIIKTESGAANIFISQSLNLDGSKPFYDPVVSFGRDGRWVPLSVKVVSTDFERQESGDYLLTASIQVESAISSPIDIVATAGGRDLVLAPKLVVTRLLLDPSKTRVLAQTVYVDDGGVSA